MEEFEKIFFLQVFLPSGAACCSYVEASCWFDFLFCCETDAKIYMIAVDRNWI